MRFKQNTIGQPKFHALLITRERTQQRFPATFAASTLILSGPMGPIHSMTPAILVPAPILQENP